MLTTKDRQPRDMYVWNLYHLLPGIAALGLEVRMSCGGNGSADGAGGDASWPSADKRGCTGFGDWLTPLLHGYYEQLKCSVFGQPLTLTLISRRSRHFAGTRYLKRGMNDKGQVANDVEVEQVCLKFPSFWSCCVYFSCVLFCLWLRFPPFERTFWIVSHPTQILHKGDGATARYTSYVQLRASIPLFWCQEGGMVIAKPAIVIQKQDPLNLATRAHFEDLFKRYGYELSIPYLFEVIFPVSQ